MASDLEKDLEKEETVLLQIQNDVYLDKGKDGKLNLLTWAAANGFADIVKLLLEKGFNVNHKCNDSEYGLRDVTPLWLASLRGHKDVVKVLLEFGPDLKRTVSLSRDDYEEYSLASYAAAKNRKDMIQILYDNNIDVTQKDTVSMGCVGRTPLRHAATYGNTDAVLALIDMGAAVKFDAGDGTLLYFAVKTKNLELIKELLDTNGVASGAYTDKNILVALWLAANTQDMNVFNLLFDFVKTRDYSLEQHDTRGYTLLTWSAKKGFVEVVQALVNAGVDPKAQDKNGKLPVELALSEAGKLRGSGSKKILSAAEGDRYYQIQLALVRGPNFKSKHSNFFFKLMHNITHLGEKKVAHDISLRRSGF